MEWGNPPGLKINPNDYTYTKRKQDTWDTEGAPRRLPDTDSAHGKPTVPSGPREDKELDPNRPGATTSWNETPRERTRAPFNPFPFPAGRVFTGEKEDRTNTTTRWLRTRPGHRTPP